MLIIKKFIDAIDKKNAIEIYEFAYRYQNRLSTNQINVLVDKLVSFKDTNYANLFLKDIDDISTGSISKLINVCLESPNDIINVIKNVDKKKLSIINAADKFVCKMVKFNDVYETISFAQVANEKELLNKTHLDKLTEMVCLSKDAYAISRYACDIETLDEDNLFKLCTSLIKLNNPERMFIFAKNAKNVNTKMIIMLYIAIISTKNLKYIDKYERNCLKRFDIITLSDFKKQIFETNDKNVIAWYLVKTNDKNLINQIYGNVDNFIIYCLVNINNLFIKTDDLLNLVDIDHFNFIDDNIKKYNNSKLLDKKGLV